MSPQTNGGEVNASHSITEGGATAASAQAAQTKTKMGISTMAGAMFLMATSAIGPGFLTQTTVFTAQMGAAFAFAILVSILVDIAIQLNVWRVLGLTGMRASELGNTVLPGLGWFMAILVFIGGAIFNIGNIAGAGLGMNAMLGIDAKIGGVISAAIAALIFMSKKAGLALDRLVAALGAIMILLMLYVAIVSNPPVGDALKNTFAPSEVDFFVITTLIGGTVGGYITFAGVHRLIDEGITGKENLRHIATTSVTGIIITGIMRVLLFLAVLGVVATGAALDKSNMAADVFFKAAGEVGLRAFGMVLFAAGLSSIIGASYTSISFITKRTTKPRLVSGMTIGLIVACTIAFVAVGQAPQKLLIFAGAFNGLILPIGVAIVLWAIIARKDLLDGYKYPKWLFVIGVLGFILCVFMGVKSFAGITALWA